MSLEPCGSYCHDGAQHAFTIIEPKNSICSPVKRHIRRTESRPGLDLVGTPDGAYEALQPSYAWPPFSFLTDESRRCFHFVVKNKKPNILGRKTTRKAKANCFLILQESDSLVELQQRWLPLLACWPNTFLFDVSLEWQSMRVRS